MQRIALGVAAAVFMLSQALTFSQSGMPPKVATDITAAEVQTVLSAPTGGTDRQLKVVDVGKYNVGVGILHRNATKSGGPVVAINHERVSEVYYVVSGSGTLITGGTVTGVKPLPPDGYLAGVRAICDEHGIVMIADEVMAGFGRCGEWFAVDRWGVTPDLITFAKGVNSGYVPLGGVIISQAIADTFSR